jgi:hypothetical protein
MPPPVTGGERIAATDVAGTASAEELWYSPSGILGVSHTLTRDVLLIAGTSVTICLRNPRRVGVYLFRDGVTTDPVTVAPWPDPDQFGFALTVQQRTFQAMLADFGTSVCESWWGYSINNQTIRVMELLRS